MDVLLVWMGKWIAVGDCEVLIPGVAEEEMALILAL